VHQIEHALDTARDLAHPYTRVVAHILAAVGWQFLRQEQAVARQAEAGVEMAMEQGFPFWVATGTVLRGWSQVSQGEVVESIQQMRTGLASMQELGAGVHRAHYLTLLAEAVGKTGDYAQALQLIEEALAEGDRSGERFYEAEAWRLKGELLLMTRAGERPQAKNWRGKAKEAEGCFLQAMEIARRQQAKSLELRVTMSLARLWQRQGKKDEARQMLAEIYSWFTEGFDTADLKEAEALLEALAH
jgi:predicted ATPase